MRAEDDEETPVKDAIVYRIDGDVFNYDCFDSIWQPGGIKAFPAEVEFFDISDIYEKNGLKKVDSERLYYDYSEKQQYNVYTENNKYGVPNQSAASALICGNEKNLYGTYPIYYYQFVYEEGSKKVRSFQWDDFDSVFIDTDNWEQYN